ncbi:MAG: MmcQ/YjbR family DNA-binding protein [Bacteroides sp.]|nr:MmcQ/YjbR family DNA-binding protein [Bacteroides sp.]
MNIEELREHCLSVKGSSESFPFTKFARGAENILAFKIMEKMFAYVDIYPSDGRFLIWMKCDPSCSAQLCRQYKGILISPRSPDGKWIGVALGSDVPDTRIRELILHSAEEVIQALPRKKQAEYHKLLSPTNEG